MDELDSSDVITVFTVVVYSPFFLYIKLTQTNVVKANLVQRRRKSVCESRAYRNSLPVNKILFSGFVVKREREKKIDPFIFSCTTLSLSRHNIYI